MRIFKFFSVCYYYFLELFDSIENLRRHIEKAIDIAADAGDVESWMSNIDVAASAKLFNVNIVREI